MHTPDLYDGEVFSDRNDAIRKMQELGFDSMLERALARRGELDARSSFQLVDYVAPGHLFADPAFPATTRTQPN